ncbi:MAG: TraM recognition domain-containing protein [Actinomycetota bacterium]|jgi:type IV secretory pathway TraG/TraD family ATPase VirD4|nr:TraM recognition domain-containing protein [Actinomycetota bacterium]
MTFDSPPAAGNSSSAGVALEAVLVRRAAAEGGIYLGRGAGGWAWAGAERSTLVLGPSRSGKTTCVVVPNVLAAPGAVVSTSTKPDVLRQTAAARADAGWVLLYDPGGEVECPPGVRRVGWSPVNAAATWDGALMMADSMSAAAHAGRERGASGEAHWTERSVSLLAPLLHAAALGGEPMSHVLHWVDRHDGSQALAILAERCGDPSPPTDVLSGILMTDQREQSGIWSTASGVLGAYRSRAAVASTEPPFLDADAFCEGANTLYVCATGSRQRLFAPLVVGLLSEVRDAAYARGVGCSAGSPVLLALDEVANIAPLPDLPAIVSEGAGQGLLTLACLQDLSQARSRWGQQADAFVSLFGATIVFGGIADVRTLEALSAVAGDVEIATRTVGSSRGPDGRVHPSVSVATIHRPRLPVDVIARGAQGWALAVDAGNRMGWIELIPAYASSPWRELVEAHPRARNLDASLALAARERSSDARGR